ncbi:UPF0481 protein [Spatholobus suberectus]|nr:UPF0481 protein [Spatholobus suberectus]
MSVKAEDLTHVMRDVLLLENQLPFLLLRLLWRNADDESALIETMAFFLVLRVWSTAEQPPIRQLIDLLSPPTHLLDLERSIFLWNSLPFDANQTQNYPKGNVIYRNIKELKAAGIGLKKGKTPYPSDISFSHGWLRSELTLPKIVGDDISIDITFNLIAYERCHDFQNDYGISSYCSFLDSLIDHPEDVKELKSQGIILNLRRSDEEVANLINTLGTTLGPERGKYSHVRAQIERHYSHKSLPTWLALGYHTYFSNPWTIIAFLAAIMGLVLTFIQTWYAIHPAK